MYCASNSKIQLKRKNNIIDAICISHTDDSDDYISNIEEWLKIKCKYGEVTLRGKYGYFTFTSKNLSKLGSFKLVIV